MKTNKNDSKQKFLRSVITDLDAGIKHNKKSIEKMAVSFGITDKTEVKEYTELAIVSKARSIALSGDSVEEKFWQIVELYKRQVTLSHRTSQSMLLQQYSTPAPISFLAGIFVNADQNISVFEPSAGNGLLTIAADPSRVIVNEIDPLRRSNLSEQGYHRVLSQDGTQPFKGYGKKFDAVITNPPFGIHAEVKYETFGIRTLDHLMALRALDTMKDNGKAAFIIGGHNRYDKKGRFQKGDWRFFFNYLYSRYNVVDLINIDGHALYSRQGTSFDVRLILIDGRKAIPSGAAPTKDNERDHVVDSFEELYERVINHVEPRQESTMNNLEAEALELLALLRNENPSMLNGYDNSRNWKQLEEEALSLLKRLSDDEAQYNSEDLGMPYTPASESCFVLDTVVPDSMGYETHAALQKIKEAVGGDIDEYVREKLNYTSKTELCKALSAEQIDAVAMAIYNIEERGQGMIIGDQTGIGKGRIAASIIRYGVEQGVQPIFITEKANLFSDIYRDLSAIGSAKLVPFIVNGRESKTDIKDEDGNVVHQALPPAEQNQIFENQRIPASYDFVVATYTQFNSPDSKPTKPRFLRSIAVDNIIIMDEAHNSSGSGNTGTFMQSAIEQTRGVVFLSATFAKRPDNMPLYAMKTSIRDASLSREGLIEAITVGGVALQEVLASQLVAEGQMIRRERSFEGVEVNYITLEEKEQEHKAIADNITEIVRDIISFQTKYVDAAVEELDDIAVEEGKQVQVREGTSQAGVDNLPYFSKVFNVINQMLFSIKAESVAERAIARLKEGKKPVIAFSSTMGSFIEQMENENGTPVSDGDVIKADFSIVLQKGLDGILRYTETDVDGRRIFKTFDITDFPMEAQLEYQRISERIQEASTGISISPIDIIIEKIQQAGYTVAEVTGRKFKVQFSGSQKNDASLGIAGGQRDYNPGQKVTQVSSGKTGIVKYIFKEGSVIPGRDNTKNYSFTYEIELDDDTSTLVTVDENDLKPFQQSSKKQYTGLVLDRKRENTNDAFRKFNNNEVDVLLINQSGSTGASAHAIVTPKVPKEKVKQRVMIVLQPELDISTEVQKRGRINRTGQILKPIYDYVNSAIPAEKRLMMMLQKKLKSLDANTTSNQKSSTKILDVPDFLNKYGDKVVDEYLAENPEINALLDFPLQSGDKEEAAHRVSGRVAVLSTELQQKFYNEISDRYNEYVDYLKQSGEYDLEVEAMDLQAETISLRPVIVGKGGFSAFGDDSVLETVRANVLKKPFTKAELKNLLTESLQGKEAQTLQEEIIGEYKAFRDAELTKDLLDNKVYFNKLRDEIATEKKLKKIQEKEGQAAYDEAVVARTKEIEQARIASEDKIKKLYTNRSILIELIMKTFYVGRLVNYPVNTYDTGLGTVPAVFLGFIIDKKRTNPYAPSSLRLRFALANGTKYMVLTGSQTQLIHGIIGASGTVSQPDGQDLFDLWERTIKESAADRKIRHIITGNVLQAFSEFRGKLVNYTTSNGATKKGILLPEYWLPEAGKKEETIVPLFRAVKIIRSLITGAAITTNNGVSILRTNQHFKIMVASARSRGGDVYLDSDLLKLVNKNNFEKVSDKMTALLEIEKIDRFVEILQQKFNDSLALNPMQYELIRKDIPKHIAQAQPKRAIAITSQSKSITIDMLELEALALELELELLNFAA